MLTGFQEGVTPNPDVLCNERIKFGAFLKHAVTNEAADQIATGHYARIRCDNGGRIMTISLFLKNIPKAFIVMRSQ